MYRIDILTLFDQTVGDLMNESILGRAQERDLIRIEAHQIRDYTLNKQKQVDNYPDGGRGAVMQADPLFRCWEHARALGEGPVRTIYLSPCGKTFTESDARRLKEEYNHLILVCGHYEGIDERFIEECVDEEISLGLLLRLAASCPPCAWPTRWPAWSPACWLTPSALRTRATGTGCWNTPSTPAPRSGTAAESPPSSSPATTPTSQSGGASSPSSAPGTGVPISTPSWI